MEVVIGATLELVGGAGAKKRGGLGLGRVLPVLEEVAESTGGL